MIGQARFTYTDQDMIAAQRAGWRWCMRWRNLLIAFLVIVALTEALLLGLNAAYGTRSAPTDALFAVLAAAAETVVLAGLMYLVARNHGRQVLRSNHAFAWNGDELGGEREWAWDAAALHLRHAGNDTDLAWSSVGAWLDAPDALLLFPSGGRPFSVPEPALAAGWKTAPKVFLYPYGGFALTLPKRALGAGDADRVIDVLRIAGAQERRPFGMMAPTSLSASQDAASTAPAPRSPSP